MNTIHAGQVFGVVTPGSSGAAFDATQSPCLYPLFFSLALIAVGMMLMALGSPRRRPGQNLERKSDSPDLRKGD